jgi:hypothetical protein
VKAGRGYVVQQQEGGSFVLANWRWPCQVDAVLELLQKFRSPMRFVVTGLVGTNSKPSEVQQFKNEVCGAFV